MEPRKAAITVSHTGIKGSRPLSAMVTTARNIFAPEEMPSTKGPAIGLRKKVCSRKPAKDSAPPSTAASSSRGSRIFHMML